jgi:flavin reductase
MSVNEGLFRAAMSRLATGVTVVTARRGERHELMTANAVTSVSLRPALLLVSVATEAHWLAAVRVSGRFAVNVLAREHEPLARWCADRARHEEPDRAHDHDVVVSPSGLLMLLGALAVAECRVYAEHPAGDHVLVIGEVDQVQVPESTREPLLFFDRDFRAGFSRRTRLREVAAS